MQSQMAYTQSSSLDSVVYTTDPFSLLLVSAGPKLRKTHELWLLVHVNNYDFIPTTVTWLFDNASNNDITLVGYRALRKDRQIHHKGDCLVYASENFSASRYGRPNFDNLRNSFWVIVGAITALLVHKNLTFRHNWYAETLLT